MKKNTINGIVIVGGNGSGKTTLGRCLAEKIHYKHMDVEDYYFPKADIPYSVSRTKDEVKILIQNDIEKYKKFILTAVSGDFGPQITETYNLVIHLEAPAEVRLRRVKERSYKQFAERMLPGGDLYEKEQQFFAFVKNRSLDKLDSWLKTVKCPILRLNGELPIDDNLSFILNYLEQFN